MIDRRLRNTALLVAGCFFMEILDGTIVVTAIPQMSRALHVSTGSTAVTVAVRGTSCSRARPLRPR